MVIFCDASFNLNPGPPGRTNPYLGGYAVCYWNTNENDSPSIKPFLAQSWKVEWLPDILHGEMLSIAEGYRIAVEHAKAGRFNGRTKFFSDSRDAIEILSLGYIKDMVHKSGLFDEILLAIVEAIIWYAYELEDIQKEKHHHQRGCGGASELHWIPGHRHDVYPHKLVDELSRDAWMGASVAAVEFGWLFAKDATTWDSTLGSEIEQSLILKNVTNPEQYRIMARDDVLGHWRALADDKAESGSESGKTGEHFDKS